MLNPILFTWLDRYLARQREQDRMQAIEVTPVNMDSVLLHSQVLHDHLVVVGYGDVGAHIYNQLDHRHLLGVRVIVDENRPSEESLKHPDHYWICGNASHPDILAQAQFSRARGLLITIPNGYQAGEIVAYARQANPNMPIIACVAHVDEKVYLMTQGATEVITGEEETARGMVQHLIHALPPSSCSQPLKSEAI